MFAVIVILLLQDIPGKDKILTGVSAGLWRLKSQVSTLRWERTRQGLQVKPSQVKADLILASKEQISSEMVSLKFLDAGVPGS